MYVCPFFNMLEWVKAVVNSGKYWQMHIFELLGHSQLNKMFKLHGR